MRGTMISKKEKSPVSNKIVYNDIFWVHWSDSIVIRSHNSKTKEADSDIFIGMLKAVIQFIKDSIERAGLLPQYPFLNIWRITFGHTTCIVKIKQYTAIIAIISGKEPEGLVMRIDKILNDLELENILIFQTWDGDLSRFNMRKITPKLRSITRIS